MGAKGGKNYILKRGDGEDPEVFTVIGGLRSTGFTMDSEAIDVSHQGSAEFKEILDEAGQISAKISGSGVCLDDAILESVEDDFLDKKIRTYQVVDTSANGRTRQGRFKITSFERTGEYKAEQTWSISLESDGPVTIV
jgi:TP901-1 family phage major tail protein